MNCKKGDLAVVVRSKFGNLGRIVQCLRLATKEDHEAYNVFFDNDPTWILDVPVNCSFSTAPLITDKQLRPLRDSNGEDEMLRIAGKPERVSA